MDFWLDTPVIGSLSNNSSRIGFVIVCRSQRSGVLAGLVADGQVEILIVLGPDLEALETSDTGFSARSYKSIATTLSRRLRATNEIVRGR